MDGSVSGGATLVRSTQMGTSFTAGVDPAADDSDGALPASEDAHHRQCAGDLRQADPAGHSADATRRRRRPWPRRASSTPMRSMTSISPSGSTHWASCHTTITSAQGLNLQQVYGGGVGWTPFESSVQQLDLKADVHYEMQTFIQPPYYGGHPEGSRPEPDRFHLWRGLPPQPAGQDRVYRERQRSAGVQQSGRLFGGMRRPD